MASGEKKSRNLALVEPAPFDNIYENKRILVTGHTGFKGSWLSLWLKMLGAEVIGYSKEPPSQPNNFEVCGLEKELIHIYGDVRDRKHLLVVLNEYKPEFVFHLAAQPLVRLSYEEPLLTYETNVMGTANLLEAVRSTDCVQVVVSVTSDKCYENREWVWGYRENDPMGGHDPYSSSKGCAELVISAYLRSFFPPDQYGRTHHVSLASVRAGNVIGGGDWAADRLIPDCVRALSLGNHPVIRKPNSIRPWQYILEPLYGYLLLGTRLWEHGSQYSGAWNFAPTEVETWDVEDVVREVCGFWGNAKYIIEDQEQFSEANWLRLDSSKAHLELGWTPKFVVKKALKKTVEWYRLYYSGIGPEGMYQFTVNQIKEYQGT